ncbi:MAG: hypothetical protein NWQ54_04415 [Paraglaciecola sp.]|nr:hypothetical protein [Paraglaciecola sp.]
MFNVHIFIPKYKLELKKNYNDFIEFSKNRLTLFSECEYQGQIGWDSNKWSFLTANGQKLSFVFGVSDNPYHFVPYQNPFSDFAKAYVRYNQSLKFHNSCHILSIFPFLYKALSEQANRKKCSIIDIIDINNNVIIRTEELIRVSGFEEQTKHTIGQNLIKIIAFLKRMHFKLDLYNWQNPFTSRDKTSVKLDTKSRKTELDKCPSDFQMLQVAEAFRLAKTPRQRYFTSLFVMLMCQPSRNIELNGLTIHSLQKSEKGRWFLMWYPAKGGDPVRKWIPKLLEEVVQQAFKSMVEISSPARLAAKFAHENPNKFLIHDSCITDPDFPQTIPLTYDQFASALNLKTGIRNGGRLNWKSMNSTEWLNDLVSKLNRVPDWRKLLTREHIISENNDVLRLLKPGQYILSAPTNISIIFPSYKDLANQVYKQYKTAKFPYLGDNKIWDCISLAREHEFHKTFKVKPFSWLKVTQGMLSDALGANRESYCSSIFDELGITDEDGSPLKITTHQPRHWLNTKLMLSGEEDWLIAKWSGRADIKQNKAYDGRTPAQKSRLTKRIGHVGNSQDVMTLEKASDMLAPYTVESPPPPLVLHDLNLPVSLTSLGVEREGVAQFTGLGYCVHNYAENPCIKNGDCVTCSDHVCLKGLPHTLEALKNLERLHEEQLAQAKASVDEQVFGADRWVTSLGFKLSKLKTIIAMLEDPDMQEGTQIRVPNEFDVSPVKRSLNIDETNIIPTLDLIGLALKNL